MKSKRAQVAVEFLSTYGWALMMAAIAIGSMSYFFLSSPDTLVPQRCEFQTDFVCEEFGFFETSGGEAEFTFLAQNIQGRVVNLTEVTCDLDGETEQALIDGSSTYPVTIVSGQQFNATCQSFDLPSRDTVNFRLEIKYIPQGLLFNTTRVGTATVGLQ